MGSRTGAWVLVWTAALLLGGVLSVVKSWGGDGPRIDASDGAPAVDSLAPEIVAGPRAGGAGAGPQRVGSVVELLQAPGTGEMATAIPGQSSVPALPEAEFFGVVVDEAGRPLSGAEVRLIGNDATRFAQGVTNERAVLGAVTARTFTDGAGVFRLRGPHVPIAEGDDACLLVLHDSHAIRTRQCLGFREGRYDAGVIEMEPGGWVVGRLVDDAGRPVPDVVVRAVQFDVHAQHVKWDPVISPHPWIDLVTSATSDAQGRFSAGPFWPGTATLEIEPPELLPAYLYEIPVTAGGRHDIGDVALARGATLSGVVVDEHDQPLPGALVCARSAPAEEEFTFLCEEIVLSQLAYARQGSCTQAAEDGGFVLEGLGGGALLLTASAPGREPACIASVEAGSAGLVLRLLPEACLLITVVDTESAQPLADATVKASRLCFAAGSGSMSTELAVESPAAVQSGTFVVHGVGSVRTQLTLAAPHHATQNVDVEGVLPGHTLQRSFALLPEATLAGRAMTADGAPLAGATVGIRLIGDAYYQPLQQTTTTDADGRFIYYGLSGGRWRGWLSAPSFATQEFSVGLTAGQASDLPDVVMLAGAVVEGVVLDAAGEPAPGTTVSATDPTRHPARPHTRTTADPFGHYELHGLPKGEWRLSFSGAGPRGEVDISLAQGEHRRLDLSPVPLAVVSGRLLAPDGSGVAGVVRAISDPGLDLHSHSRSVTADTEADGRFELRLPPGRHALSAIAEAPCFGVAPALSLTLESGEVRACDIVLGEAQITGRVTDAESGAPLPGVRVSCDGFDSAPDDAWPVSNSEGRFVLQHLVAGPRTLTFHVAGHADLTLANVPADLDPQPVDVKLWRGATIRGTVHTASGGSAPDRTTIFLLPGPDVPFVATGSTDAGAFLIPDVAPGAYLVVVSSGWTNNDGIVLGDFRAEVPVTLSAGEIHDVALVLRD